MMISSLGLMVLISIMYIMNENFRLIKLRIIRTYRIVKYKLSKVSNAKKYKQMTSKEIENAVDVNIFKLPDFTYKEGPSIIF